MQTWANYRKVVEEFPKGQKQSLQDVATKKDTSFSSKLIEPKDATISETLGTKKKLGKRLGFLKRVSPFLLLELFLMALFPYMIITGTGFIHNKWLLFFLFVFIEINVLFTDFALWNYFEGKKILRIWLIEIPLTFLIIHLLF